MSDRERNSALFWESPREEQDRLIRALTERAEAAEREVIKLTDQRNVAESMLKCANEQRDNAERERDDWCSLYHDQFLAGETWKRERDEWKALAEANRDEVRVVERERDEARAETKDLVQHIANTNKTHKMEIKTLQRVIAEKDGYIRLSVDCGKADCRPNANPCTMCAQIHASAARVELVRLQQVAIENAKSQETVLAMAREEVERLRNRVNELINDYALDDEERELKGADHGQG